MEEIKGYLLTEEEQEACINLIKEMRKTKDFTLNFTGSVNIRAKNLHEANEIFWDWVGDLKDKSFYDWHGSIIGTPFFEKECIEEE